MESPGDSLSIPRLIVGLGNPGESYRDTRHNVGYMVLDEVARRMSTTFQHEKRWNCMLARSGATWLLKPLTFMNLSGEAVAGVAHFYKLKPAETLVTFDDVDMPIGSVRLRPSGSAGGHNGMRSIISLLGTNEFPRLKLGIAAEGGRPAGDKLSGHVLGRFSEDERAGILQAVDRAADAVALALRSGIDAAMNLFNRK
ncbi:MAG: peptidyl-trna hydrolase [Verrucomicrobiaceae bacterium]|nr:peptidyl-trna hydrolase [Verrucomicrobiaceae bacterium]